MVLPPITALEPPHFDAVAAGYKVIVIKNLSRGVAPDTSQKAIEEMKAKGVIVLEKIGTHPF